jgi:hypothetical protein
MPGSDPSKITRNLTSLAAIGKVWYIGQIHYKMLQNEEWIAGTEKR